MGQGNQDYQWIPDSQGNGGHWQQPVVPGSSSDTLGPNGYGKGNANYDAVNNAKIHAMGATLMSRDQSIMGRQAPTLADNSYQFGQVNDSRNQQLAQLANQQTMAQGGGPSLAAAQNRVAMGAGLSGANSAMGAAGSPLAQRAAMMGGNSALGQLSAQGAGQRGNEMYNNMGNYAQGANGLRQGDLGAQSAAMQQTAAQRNMQLNQYGANSNLAQGYEGNDFSAAQNYSQLAQQTQQYRQNIKDNMVADGMNRIGTAAAVAGTTMAMAAA